MTVSVEAERLRCLTPAEFSVLGSRGVAYVKAVDGGCAVFAADGVYMATLPDRDVARAAIVQHDMTPADVH